MEPRFVSGCFRTHPPSLWRDVCSEIAPLDPLKTGSKHGVKAETQRETQRRRCWKQRPHAVDPLI